MIDRFRRWWQIQTGEEETPIDGDTPAWLISLLFHLALLFVIALISVPNLFPDYAVTMTTSDIEELEEDLIAPEDFQFNPETQEDIGANSFGGVEAALAMAPNLSDISDVPSPDMDISKVGFEINETIALASGPQFNENLAVKGSVGVGVTGASGAVDRITQEILTSLEERRTHVIWLFDQSGSLEGQRAQIYERFDRIYEELGVIEASGNKAFAKYEDKPLLSSVVAFGKDVTLRTKLPTDDLAEIKKAVKSIEMDRSGVENVFQATYMAIDRFKGDRTIDQETGEPKRNVMVVVFTDEIGDDHRNGLETTIQIARQNAVPVYVVGVPAPFGRLKTKMKWIDPDPQFDQSPQWGVVTQGPETLMSERLRLHFAGVNEDEDSIDSGFGPFALTRLCYETGGIFFAVHPNRVVGRSVGRKEVAAMASHMKYFFDPQVMRKYRPDYVSPAEYSRRVMSLKSRQSLVKAAGESWLGTLEKPKLKFTRRSEAELAVSLTEAQKKAASLEPKVMRLYQILKFGEVDRSKETVLRWQAGYDLAMGRVMAIKARTEAYNAMLAQAKRGMKFKTAGNNTWELRPSSDLTLLGSQLTKTSQKANEYLTRVIQEHPDTPWALLAKRELETELGWEWVESKTDLSPRPAGGGGNGGNPKNDVKRVIKKGPVKRPLPPL